VYFSCLILILILPFNCIVIAKNSQHALQQLFFFLNEEKAN
jgi:hypothetical protein